MHYQIMIVVDDPLLRQRYAETLESDAQLGRALQELGRIIKSMFRLQCISDAS